MSANDALFDLLAAPLGADWTVDRLAEELLCAIATRTSDDGQEFVLDGETITDRQTHRVLRPLLACLAAKSAAEAGGSPNLYGGGLFFKRPGRNGPVWILGQFENRQGSVRLALRRTASLPENSEQVPERRAASRR